jgi:hypothetical protein
MISRSSRRSGRRSGSLKLPSVSDCTPAGRSGRSYQGSVQPGRHELTVRWKKIAIAVHASKDRKQELLDGIV